MTPIPISVDGGLVLNMLAKLAPAPASAGTAGGGQLHAAGSTFEAACRETWAKLSALVERSVHAGWDAVRDEVRLFSEFVEQSAAELGRQAQALRDFVLEKVRAAINRIVDALLALLRAELTIGGRRYVLNDVQMQSRLKFSGGIEASVAALCKLAGEGEITVGGQYRLEMAANG